MTDRVVASVTVPGRVESVRPVSAFLVALARQYGVPAAADTLFENAVVEALNNAIEHTGDGGEGALRCDFELEGRRLRIRVLHDASRIPVLLSFSSDLHLDPPQSWEQISQSGYGLYLIRAVFPDVHQITIDGRHGVEMALMF